MKEFARTEQLIGREGLEVLEKARVAVFGLGAVGSYAVEALARMGVGHLRIIDFDTVNITNINRQLYALHSTVDEKKTSVAERRIHDINPSIRLDVRDAFVNEGSLADLLDKELDAVVDAIDGLNSKVNLICGAVERGIAVVSSMGAAGRTDPSMIRTGDVSETSVCPLARFVRRRLRRRGWTRESDVCFPKKNRGTRRNTTRWTRKRRFMAGAGRPSERFRIFPACSALPRPAL